MMWMPLVLSRIIKMPNDKQRLGMIGSGMAAKAGKEVMDRKKKTKKKLDDIMSQMRQSRGKSK